jgi:broad specificity phosphatase PhoE
VTSDGLSTSAAGERLRLFYFRHGETLWSLSGQHTGATEIPLTSHGEAQARALRPWVKSIAFTRVLTSPRLRARATCELAGLGQAYEIEPDLAEWSYGDYEGRRSVEIREERPGWNIFRDGCPNGESPSAISDRADRLIERLETLRGDVALFAHGHIGAVLGARWIGLGVTEGQHLALRPASMSVMGSDLGHPEISVLTLWNASPEQLAPAIAVV